MRLIAIIAFLALLTVPCIAEPDNVTTGPYKVSFDLGIPESAYTVTVENPHETESLSGEESISYSIEILNKTNFGFKKVATITMSDRENTTVPTPAQLVDELTAALYQAGLRNVNAAQREIDGILGAAASGMYLEYGLENYQASYCPPEPTIVSIVSSYPWDEGTLSLLKTIHVEKINETS